MKISVLTLHPALIEATIKEGLISKAVKNGRIFIEAVSLRKFADAPHFQVDDKPYGGGPGMLLKVDVIVKALRSLKPSQKRRIIVFSAKGRRLTQARIQKWSRFDSLVFICGRYEGIDQRVSDHYADEEVRVGDFVYMGGEAAALASIEAVARLCPDVIGNRASLFEESFSKTCAREHGQYTRPKDFEGHEVPAVLLTGHHARLQEWKKSKRLGRVKR